MAEQNKLFPFVGKLGNVIGYQRNGKYFLRSMPEKVHQTRATRRASERFGIASRKAALIRSAFCDDLDMQGDKTYINSLNSALMTYAQYNIAALTGFRFNPGAGIDKFFEIMPVLADDGTLHIPAQSLPQFKGITSFEVKVIAARMHFGTLRLISTDAAIIYIDPRQAFTGAAIPLDAPGNGTLIVTLQIRAIQDGIPSSNKRYMAADIVAVTIPQKEAFKERNTVSDYPQPYSSPKRLITPLNCVPGDIIQRE